MPDTVVFCGGSAVNGVLVVSSEPSVMVVSLWVVRV